MFQKHVQWCSGVLAGWLSACTFTYLLHKIVILESEHLNLPHEAQRMHTLDVTK